MFSKTRSDAQDGRDRSGARAGPATPSVISADMRIIGNLKSEGDIRIDGHVEGDIQCARVTVGDGAQVSGEIRSDTVVVQGRICGTIFAADVELHETAVIIGDIVHKSIEVSKGASIEGNLRRADDKDTAAEQRRPPMVSLIAPGGKDLVNE